MGEIGMKRKRLRKGNYLRVFSIWELKILDIQEILRLQPERENTDGEKLHPNNPSNIFPLSGLTAIHRGL